MQNLSEKEEKELGIDQLKIDLISRFFPFSNDEIIKFKDVIKFSGHHLMKNEAINWNVELLEKLSDKIAWTAITGLKNINFDLAFFQQFENFIDFNSIYLSKNIVWDQELINQYGDRIAKDWNKPSIINSPLLTLDNIRKHKDKLDWEMVSRHANLSFTDEVIDEFQERWDWKNLSSNRHLPLSVEFIEKYIDKLYFDELSLNPACVPHIFKYPTSKRWNWDLVIINSGIIYNQETFNFIFPHYKKYYESKEYANPIYKKYSLSSLLFRVFMFQVIDLTFFLQDHFIPHLPWKILSERCRMKLTFEFINKYKKKLNFKEDALIYNNGDIITYDFIMQNLPLFDTESRYFIGKLPITVEIIQTYIKNIRWWTLAGNQNFDWSWEFINEHLYDLYCYRWFNSLSYNQGIYEKLISRTMSRNDILEFLEMQLFHQRRIDCEKNQSDRQQGCPDF
ncbi:MAG: hypothetical protein K0B14_16035 [Anaerolineaceae bacterium]|nr:hypothetical protein [Anaerolineaceae bacterium]